MRTNRKVRKSTVRLKKLGMDREERRAIIETSYSFCGRLDGKHEDLHHRLKRFRFSDSGEVFYDESLGDSYIEANFDPLKVSVGQIRNLIYSAIA